MGAKILAFDSHCSVNFQPISKCFVPNFELKYEDSENRKADRVITVVFNLHQIKRLAFLGLVDREYCRWQLGFFGTPGITKITDYLDARTLFSSRPVFSFTLRASSSN